MKESIKFKFLVGKLYYKDQFLFGFYDDSRFVGMELGEMVKSTHWLKTKSSRKMIDAQDDTNEEFIANLVLDTNIPKPDSYPKFNNETNFKVHWGTKNPWRHNPEIVAIGWTGIKWKYQFRNLGHDFPETSEEELILIEKEKKI